LRLDLLRPAIGPALIPGTDAPLVGVAPFAAPVADMVAPVPVRGLGWRSVLAVIATSLALLGQGERSHVDPRFRTPSATLLTYWEAQREGDADAAQDCFVNGRDDQPLPGALWFMPPTDAIWIDGIHSLPVTAGRVMVRYEVHFRVVGSGDERMFKTGGELVRSHGEWRIVQPLGEASMPEWKPEPMPVDI
jgi:hypothetical protein